MTWRGPLLCVLAAVCAVASPAAQDQEVRSDQQILMQLERDWDAAFHRKDVKFIETVLADEFVATYGDGRRADRAKELALATERDEPVDSSTLDESTSKAYG